MEASNRITTDQPLGQAPRVPEQHHIDIRNGHGERRLPDGRVLRVKVAQGKKRRARMPLIITIEPVASE